MLEQIILTRLQQLRQLNLQIIQQQQKLLDYCMDHLAYLKICSKQIKQIYFIRKHNFPMYTTLWWDRNIHLRLFAGKLPVHATLIFLEVGKHLYTVYTIIICKFDMLWLATHKKKPEDITVILAVSIA